MPRYRIPIVKKTPFIVRRPIREETAALSGGIQRKPIIGRNFDISECKLFSSSAGCSGVKYVLSETGSDEAEVGLVRIKLDSEIAGAISIINAFNEAKRIVRVITKVSLPFDLLRVLSKSPFNVVQYEVNPLTDLDVLRKSIFHSNGCGLYTSIVFDPVLPSVTKVMDITQTISDNKLSINYVGLKFYNGGFDYETEDTYVVKGRLVPKKYCDRIGKTINVNVDFRNKFVDTLNFYVKNNKINVMLCNEERCY